MNDFTHRLAGGKKTIIKKKVGPFLISSSMGLLFTAVYSHKDDLLAESKTDPSRRVRHLMLTYSATDTLRTLMASSDSEYFEGIVKYDGIEVSALLLPNGFKVVGLVEASAGESGEEAIRSIAHSLLLSILDPAFDENTCLSEGSLRV
jgi:hypothetical protein